jgi:hypothetical protein
MPAAAALFAMVMVVAACGEGQESATGGRQLPPDSAPPDVVLQAYLEAVRVGDCATAGHFVVPATFRKGNGELCGGIHLHGYRQSGVPLTPNANEILVGMTLTTDGSSDGSIPAGDLLCTYDLVRQPTGAWRIVAAGQG